MGSAILESLVGHLGRRYVVDLRSFGASTGGGGGRTIEDVLYECARDPMVRLLACGGDGTCGWILSSLDRVWSRIFREEEEEEEEEGGGEENGRRGGGSSSTSRKHLHLSTYRDHLPLAIMPLGTGNDLSRQYGWGGTFQSHMRGRGMITSVIRSRLTHLDTWRCMIMPMQKLDDDERRLIPRILAESHGPPVHDDANGGEDSPRVDPTVSQTSTQLLQSLLENDDDNASSSHGATKSPPRRKNVPKSVPEPLSQIFDGSFCNYFSLGFDAAMAYRFHREREEHPEKFTSSLKNKVVYARKTPHALRSPKLRGLVKVLVNDDGGQLVELKVPKNCRAIVSYVPEPLQQFIITLSFQLRAICFSSHSSS
jgi:hypothetical protein